MRMEESITQARQAKFLAVGVYDANGHRAGYIQALVAPQTPQGVLVRGHAGLVIDKRSSGTRGARPPLRRRPQAPPLTRARTTGFVCSEAPPGGHSSFKRRSRK